jgi:hypothetical protein
MQIFPLSIAVLRTLSVAGPTSGRKENKSSPEAEII